MKYRIYIDEVGNPDLASSDDPNRRFLSLTGVIIGLEYVERTLHPKMEALKSKFFRSHPDDPVVLHRKEILNAKPPFQVLRDTSIIVMMRVETYWLNREEVKKTDASRHPLNGSWNEVPSSLSRRSSSVH